MRASLVGPAVHDEAAGTAPTMISISLAPPDSTKSHTHAGPRTFSVGAGVCRQFRRELDADREVRLAAGQGFAPDPRHHVHFTDCWVCTGCGHPVAHHFDCVRTLEQLEAARAKRIDETTGLNAFVSVSSRRGSTPASGASSARPRSPLQRPEWCAVLNEEASAFYGKHPRDGFESPSMTHENIAPTMPVFAADPRYMAHVENGAWVCSFPSCLHPIEVHRSDPATADVHKQLQDPPASSNLSILAPFVGRVGAVSPRASSHSSNNGHFVPHDVPNNAFIARCRMGNYADICCVCGYPAAQRYHKYPLWKTSKYGETLRPGVTNGARSCPGRARCRRIRRRRDELPATVRHPGVGRLLPRRVRQKPDPVRVRRRQEERRPLRCLGQRPGISPPERSARGFREPSTSFGTPCAC
jgi:hypothetical protein